MASEWMTGDESTADILERLGTQVSTLIRQHLALASAEVADNAAAGLAGIVSAAFAVALVAMSSILLIVTAVLALATAMDAWLAALIVALALLLPALPIGLFALSRLRRVSLLPTRTIAWAKEDIQWLAEQTRSGARS
jgi:uncharacterized membrane protein YqjE